MTPSAGRVDAVGAVVFDQRGALLVIRRGRPPSEGLWSLPGGRVEDGETLEQALVREVREETGLEVEPDGLVATVTRGPYDIHDFRAHVVGGQPVPGDDASALQFVNRDDLRRLNVVPLLWEFLEENGCLPAP